MDKSKVIKNAKGDSVTRSKLNEAILSSLEEGEQPHFIFPIPAGVTVDGSGSNSFKESKYDWNIVITDARIFIIKELEDNMILDQISLSNVEDLDGKAGGLLSIGEITVKTINHTYTGKLHKKIDNEELSQASKFVRNWDRDQVDISSKIPNSSNLNSATAHAELNQVKVIESYGANVPEGLYALEMDTEGLHFIEEMLFGSEESYFILHESIIFDDMSTSSQRDFGKENLSRYVNQINPLLDDASPTKKQNEDIIKIPLDGGNGYITLTPGVLTAFKELLNGLSRIDPRLKSNNMDTSEGKREVDDAPKGTQSALEILKQRLAKGEISTEEFEERKQYIDE